MKKILVILTVSLLIIAILYVIPILNEIRPFCNLGAESVDNYFLQILTNWKSSNLNEALKAFSCFRDENYEQTIRICQDLLQEQSIKLHGSEMRYIHSLLFLSYDKVRSKEDTIELSKEITREDPALGYFFQGSIYEGNYEAGCKINYMKAIYHSKKNRPLPKKLIKHMEDEIGEK